MVTALTSTVGGGAVPGATAMSATHVEAIPSAVQNCVTAAGPSGPHAIVTRLYGIFSESRAVTSRNVVAAGAASVPMMNAFSALIGSIVKTKLSPEAMIGPPLRVTEEHGPLV